MLITASTVLDTAPNVRRFVAGNLAMGVDHMVVFLDSPAAPGQADVAEELDAHPDVTCVPTDLAWWGGRRPRQLNVRQRINANIVVWLMEPVREATWVVHVDGDEVVAADAEALAAVPASCPALWLTPLEAVSSFAPDGAPRLFKSLLGEDDLHLLAVLGVIPAATNQAYFHGHVLGKSGVRPTAGLHLTLHDAVDPTGQRVPAELRHEAPDLRVLHFDAPSGEEFIRKWRAMIAAGPVAMRPDRAPMARALRSLVGKDLPPAVAETYLRRIYEATTEDDVAALGDLGLLTEVDPEHGTHAPQRFSEQGRRTVEARLAEVATQPKLPFHVNHDGGAKRGGKPEVSEPGFLSRLPGRRREPRSHRRDG